MKKGYLLYVIIFAVIMAIAVILGCAFGAAPLSLQQVINGIFGSGTDAVIVRSLRLPRVLAALLAGGGLTVCGCALQGLFRNPMADTGILGISSGASLGVTVCIVFLGGATGLISFAAFISGLLTVAVIYLLSRLFKSGTTGLLLTGICVSAFLSALQNMVLMADHTKVDQVFAFTMGSFSGADNQKLTFAAPIILIGCILVFLLARPLNLLQAGNEQAASAGLDIRLIRGLVLLLTALICSASVMLGGVISFVGLIIPHCMRYLSGGDFRRLLPLSFLCGGGFMVLADLLSRTLFAPAEIPIGIFTALLGAPLFFYLLARRNKYDKA